jgi:WD40 repeat protein/DNA-binding SARP family transcriptional activator
MGTVAVPEGLAPTGALDEKLGTPAYRGRMQFRVLGPLEVAEGGRSISLGGPKQRAVLAHLLVRANELVPAETLVDQIWGEEPPEKARNIIQTYISHLRKALGRDRIQSHAPGYRLSVESSELDSNQFDSLVRDAKKTLAIDPNIAVGMFEDALGLWRGPALADLADHPSLLAEAARLDDLRLEAQEHRMEGLLASGAQARAIGELEILLARHPWRESLWGLLMLAFYREGRQADALNTYQRAREILADELGIDPSPELTRLHERVLQQDPGLDLRGEPLRGYRLLEKIDDGPIGVVFRAIQPHVERDVAVKIFHEAIAADPAFVRRFEPGAQAVTALEHPHIAPVYDYWREPGRAYIVSRYLRGGSLRALETRGESLERDRALRVVEQIALALSFAHRQGVAHGSIQASNILFDGDGNAYVGDFRVGIGPPPDPSDDVRELAELATRLLPKERSFTELAARLEVVQGAPDADAFAKAARTALEPGSVAVRERAVERNPYKGLRAFTEADARDFFGRGELVRRLLARLREGAAGSRFLALVGPSGSGKSSVVRAGLVPAIRQGALSTEADPFVAEMFPGTHPMDDLEAALVRIAVRPVPRLLDRLVQGSRGLLEAIDLIAPGDAEVFLVVDQFEECFTLTTDEAERELFLESLRVASADPESRLRVIVTLRADFYDRPLIYPRFGALLADRTEAVPPLVPDELEKAIRGPAEGVGVSLEPGLVAEMIADVAHQPGALPLLQYALTELFERRDGDHLTLPAYREIGGIAGALSARADRIYESTDPSGRRAAKQMFLRLVTLGEGSEDTRRRVGRSELDALDVEGDAIDAVVETFGRHRLLTFDRESSTREPTVEIAHEALLRAWGRLHTWIDDAREDLRQDRGLGRAATEWHASKADDSFLLRGARLEQIETWAGTTDLAIGRPQRAYLKASVDQRDRERAEEDLRYKREIQTERRSSRRLRGLVALFAAAALVTGSLTVVARNQRSRAKREARVASSRELAASAVANLEVDPELSVLLARAAIETTRSAEGTVLPEAEEALHRAVVASRLELEVAGLGGDVAWSPAGVFATEGPEDTGIIDIRDSETGERVLEFKGHDIDLNDVQFSPDGSQLASTGDDGKLKVWDPETGQLVAAMSGAFSARGPSFSADGSLVAAAWGEEVRVFALPSKRVLVDIPTEDGYATALSPDGKRLAIISERSAVFDIRTGKKVFALGGHGWAISWSPDGRYVATGGEQGVRVWDAETGKLRHTLFAHGGSLGGVAWSPDSSRLVTGGSDGTVKVWGLELTGVRQLFSLSAHGTRSGVLGVTFSPDGSRVMAGDLAVSAVSIWNLGTDGDAEWGNLPSSGGAGARFMPDGRRLVASSGHGSALTIWDLQTRRALQRIGPTSDRFRFHSFAINPDGRSIAAGGGLADGNDFGGEVARAWDIASGEELYRVRHGWDVMEVGFSPDGEYMVSAGWSAASKIVDRSGRVVSILKEPGFNQSGARFSSDGRFVVTASFEGLQTRMRIWDWRRREVVRTIDDDVSKLWPSLDVDPTGSRVVAAGPEGAVDIWDATSGTRVAVLGGPSGGVNRAVFSPDGQRVATASDDGAVRLFDADSGQELLVLRGSGCSVRDVAFSSDGKKLASTDCDGVRIWALDIDDLLQIADREVPRSLTDAECVQYLHTTECPQTRR